MQQQQCLGRLTITERVSLKIEMDKTNTFAKEGLPGRAFFYRPMFGRNRHHHARADDSAGLPRLSLWSLLLSSLALQNSNITWALCYCPLGFDQKPRRVVISPRSRRRKRHVRAPSGMFAPSFLDHG